MQAIIFVSLNSIFDVMPFECKALAGALKRVSARTDWSIDDHMRFVRKGSVLQSLSTSTDIADGHDLAPVYLEIFNEILETIDPMARAEAVKALELARAGGLQRGLVSDYPVYSTNLARSGALGTSASKLGMIEAIRDHTEPASTTDSLIGLTEKMGVSSDKCIAMFTRKTDKEAALALGMKPILIRDTANKESISLKPRSANYLQKLLRDFPTTRSPSPAFAVPAAA